MNNRLCAAVALASAFFGGCQSVCRQDAFMDEILASCHCMCFGHKATRAGGSRWYVKDSGLDKGDMFFVEWRWLEDVQTHRRFYVLANDLRPFAQRISATRFDSFEELQQSVVSAIEEDIKTSRRFPCECGHAFCLFMVEKIGFPENSPLPFKEYCNDKIVHCFPTREYCEGEVLESTQDYVQFYSGAAFKNRTAESTFIGGVSP